MCKHKPPRVTEKFDFKDEQTPQALKQKDRPTERKHKRKNGGYDCEEKRISDIYNEFIGKDYIVVRWNPHTYKTSNNTPKMKQKERLELFVKVWKKMRTIKTTQKIVIIYMFYDKDNPKLSQRIPHYFIDNENDLNKLNKL